MIHCFSQGGLHIVLDTDSGSVHVVDGMSYDVIRYMDAHPDATREEIADALSRDSGGGDASRYEAADILECIDEAAGLRAAGKLWREEEYKSIAPHVASPPVVKALCLHVAHSCNLTCSYCFAGQGKYRGESALMSFETGRAALDWLIAHSGSHRHLEVDFFGGEPLLNLGVVKDLVAYARSVEGAYGKHFRFTLTTNGMLIDDDVIDFVNHEMDNVVLSLDGRREVHDRFRVDSMGRGSWERIVPLFKRLVDARGPRDYYIRGTFTHLNPDFLNDIKEMLDLGFNRLSMEPVVTGPGDPLALTEDDITIAEREYEELSELMLSRAREGRPFIFYHYMIDLRNGPCIYKRIKGCGSGSEYMAVTPRGELYPCHQFVGEEEMLIGNISEGIKRLDLCEEFASADVYARAACRDCWAKYYCSGGCAANAYHSGGSILSVYEPGCRLFKKRIECAIYVEAKRHMEGHVSADGR